MQQLPARSAEQALQGMASGVNVITNGVPGQGSKIFIRGVTNFGNTDPLVIVDGIEQDLNLINANDIESVQVLKDGSGSIYGVRGANGVILVTTKKGKRGAPVISYDMYYGMTYPLPGNVFDLLDSKDFEKVFNIGRPGNLLFANGMSDYMYRGPAGAGVAMAGDPVVDPSLYFYESPNKGNNYIIQEFNKEGTDWFHELFKKAPTMNHNLTASGGTEKSRYFFALGYYDQQGTLINTFLKRYSARVNTEFTLGDHIRVGENLSVIYNENPGFNNQVEFGGIAETYKMYPIVPPYDIGGKWAGTFGGPELGSNQNPVAAQIRNIDKDRNYDWYIIGNTFAEVDFLKGFTARTSFGLNIRNSYDQNFTATQVENVQASTNDNSLSVTAGYGMTMTFTNTLTYTKTLGRHAFNGLIGMEAIGYKARSVVGSSGRFFNEDINFLTLGGGVASVANGSSISENSLFSIFGRLDYAFDDKYLVAGTIRRDGSSRFGPGSRYGVFPSFSLGWRLSNESFMQNLSWLNELKLRGGYGVMGSQNNVSGDNSFSLYGSSLTGTYYDITGASTSTVQGFAKSRIGNLNTSWEENIVTNVGIDMAILGNALDFSVDYYQKKIKGLLFTQPLPAVIIGGASAPTVNIGNIQNTGVDASVTYRGNISKVNFSVRANITSYNNTVKEIPDPGYFYSGSLQGLGGICRNETGHPVSSFFGYNILGLFQSDEEVASAPPQAGAKPGDFRYEDVNGDNEITPDDRKHLGHPNPDFTYGLNLNLDYMGFDLSAMFYGSQGNEMFNATRAYLHFFSYYQSNKSNVLLNAWTPENRNTTVPVISNTNTISNGGAPNSYYIEDASFLKLKSLILGYSIKPSFLQKIRISKFRLYVQAVNLFTATKYTGLDPELGGSSASFGIDRGNFPNNERSFLFGISAAF
jgi:TonB-linked SusC/RagA family outer membrane protein